MPSCAIRKFPSHILYGLGDIDIVSFKLYPSELELWTNRGL